MQLKPVGQIMLCSVCHRTCSVGGPDSTPLVQKLGAVQIAGFTSMVELAADGVCASRSSISGMSRRHTSTRVAPTQR